MLSWQLILRWTWFTRQPFIPPTRKRYSSASLPEKRFSAKKPMTMTAQEARELFSLAGKKDPLMEAMWTRFLPVWREVRERVNRGDIGAVRYMRADFSDFMPFEPDSRIYDPARRRALLDIGYMLSDDPVYSREAIAGFFLYPVIVHQPVMDDFAAVLLESAEGLPPPPPAPADWRETKRPVSMA